MTNKPESAAVEAVAWAMTDYQADGANTQFTRDRYAAEYWGGQGIQIDPLYPQSALDALRGEVERLREALDSCREAGNKHVQRRCQMDDEIDRLVGEKTAAERRVAQLETILEQAMAHPDFLPPGLLEAIESALTKVTP